MEVELRAGSSYKKGKNLRTCSWWGRESWRPVWGSEEPRGTEVGREETFE